MDNKVRPAGPADTQDHPTGFSCAQELRFGLNCSTLPQIQVPTAPSNGARPEQPITAFDYIGLVDPYMNRPNHGF